MKDDAAGTGVPTTPPRLLIHLLLSIPPPATQLKHVGDWRRDLTPLGAVALPHPADSPLPQHDTGEDEVDVEEVDNMAVPGGQGGIEGLWRVQVHFPDSAWCSVSGRSCCLGCV